MNASKHDNSADRLLVNAVLAGDNKAFGVIIKNTEKLVAQIIYKMVSAAEDRKDLAQDVYLNAYKNLSSFRFNAKLSTWIARIAYNACHNHLEKKQLILRDDLHEIANNTVETESLHVDLKKRSFVISCGIEQLPPVSKTLITLFHMEELSYAEIHEITQLPEGTIKSYLFRARKSLKDYLLLHYKNEEL